MTKVVGDVIWTISFWLPSCTFFLIKSSFKMIVPILKSSGAECFQFLFTCAATMVTLTSFSRLIVHGWLLVSFIVLQVYCSQVVEQIHPCAGVQAPLGKRHISNIHAWKCYMQNICVLPIFFLVIQKFRYIVFVVMLDSNAHLSHFPERNTIMITYYTHTVTI